MFRRHRLFVVQFLLMLGLSIADSEAETHPVSAVKPSDGSLFLLTSDGTVLAMNLSLTSASVVAKFNSATGGIVADLAYGVVDGRPSLFIASSHSTGHAIIGLIQEFTTDGHLLATWITQHVVNGIAFDVSSNLVYFSSGDSREIYAINPKRKSSPAYVSEIAGAGKLGSLAVDPIARKLYISDIGEGKVYALSLSNRHVDFVGAVGTPQALLLNEPGNMLLVADSSRHQVVSLPLQPSRANPVMVTPRNSFRSPTGLAWGDPAHFIVADQDAGTVSLVTSSSGQILYTVPLP